MAQAWHNAALELGTGNTTGSCINIIIISACTCGTMSGQSSRHTHDLLKCCSIKDVDGDNSKDGTLSSGCQFPPNVVAKVD